MTGKCASKMLIAVSLAVMVAASANAGTDCSRAATGQRQCCLDLVEQHQGRGWLGIETKVGMDGAHLITSVVPDSPAALAGLRPGDAIKWVDGIPPTAAASEADLLPQETIGRTIPIGVRRGDDHLILFATIAEIPQAVLASLREEHRKSHPSD